MWPKNLFINEDILLRDLILVKSHWKADVNEMKENNMLRHIIRYKTLRWKECCYTSTIASVSMPKD